MLKGKQFFLGQVPMWFISINVNPFFREWNCNVCKSDVKVIADAMRANETADKFLPIFQGWYKIF